MSASSAYSPAARHGRRRGSMRGGTFALVLMASWLLGCMDMGDWDRPCLSSLDCPPDQSCILGTCTALPDFEVEVEVIPPTTSPFLPFSARGVDLDSPEGLSLAVPPPTSVRGELLFDQEPYRGEARLSFSAETDLRRAGHYSVDARAEGQDPSAFELKLAGSMLDGGRTEAIPYTVTASPQDNSDCCMNPSASCPVPVRMSGVRFRTDTDDLVLAFPESAARIIGKVITATDDSLPLAGVRVQAVSASRSAHSLPVETGEDGAFCLAMALDKSADETPVRVRVGPTSVNPAVPTIEYDLMVHGIEGMHDVKLVTGDFGAPLRVVGELVSQRDEPVEGAQVTFTGQVATGGSYSVTAFSDSSGGFSADLLRGTYHVRAVPPQSSESAAREVADLVIGGEGGEPPPALFTEPLPDRSTLSGRVLGPGSGRPPMADLEVLAQLEGAGGNGSARIERFSALTDEDGRFVLLLDPGSYRLHFRPPWSTELPWMVGPLELIEAGDSRDMGSVLLEESSSFDGKVLGEVENAKTIPLAGAKVEVHARRREQTYLLWEGRADEEGAFQVLLPRSLTGKVEATVPPPEPAQEDDW